MIAHLAASTLVALVAVAAGLVLRGKCGAWRHALLAAAILRFAIPTPWLAAAGAKLAPYAHTRAAGPDYVNRFADFLLFGDARSGLSVVRSKVRTERVLNPIIFGWAAGFALFCAVWIRGLLRGIPGVREASAEELAVLARALRAFGSRTAARLRIAAAEQAPGVRGMWSGSIILPDGLSANLSAAELEAVLAHELAHVRRRDNLSAAMAHLVVCAFWFYPPIWWLERRMLQEREAACDEMVLARGANAEEYLSGLVKVCRMSFSTAAGYAGAGGSNFQIRMERIMSADFTQSSSPIWRAGAAAIVALAVIIPVSGGFLKARQAAQDHEGQESQTIAPAPSPTSAEGRIQAGMAMLQAGNPAGAEEAFRMAHELDPKSTLARMAVVEALLAQGETDRAIWFLQEEMAHSGARADLHLALGNAAVRGQKYDLALAEFQAALNTLDPDSADAGDIYFRMGETYQRMGNTEAAIVQIRLAKNLLPNRGDIASTLALCLDSAGRWEEAQKEYAAVLRIDPNNAVALNNLAYLLSQHGGDLDLAVNYAQHAAQFSPQLLEVSDTLGTLYLAKGRTDDALEIFRKILQKSPADAEHMALRLADKGQRDAVWAALTAALAKHYSNEDDQAITRIMQKLH
jgi:beta-lactamase regulating signal transducer with metallopeptidase domain/tetratricopeptide (TPR) repeat protein